MAWFRDSSRKRPDFFLSASEPSSPLPIAKRPPTYMGARSTLAIRYRPYCSNFLSEAVGATPAGEFSYFA